MRIGSRLSGVELAAQHFLSRAMAQLNESSLRLATMRRVNHGSDDPAALVAIENLRAELTSIKAANDNAARAAGMVRLADSGMAQVTSLLNSIRGNVVAAAGGGLSDAEVAGKQIEIDAALEAVNRIANDTSFGGRKLLDGSAAEMTFAFSPDVDHTVTLSLPDVHVSALGGATGRLSDLAGGGSASLTSGNLAQAIDVLDTARGQVLEARARAGAFEKYTIESTARVLDGMEVSLSSALSMIRDTDVAAETSQLVRSQILVDAATATLMLAGKRGGLFGQLLG
jgi:flagellin